MVELSKKGIENKEQWELLNIDMPHYDVEKMVIETIENPRWIHFGAGNIFRGFIAVLQQRLLNEKLTDTGIIAVESFDFQIIDTIYKKYDNLSLLVLMDPDGSLDKEVIASVADSIKADSLNKNDWRRLQEIFNSPSLQMVSFTITEKGYNLTKLSGDMFPVVVNDIKNGPFHPKHTMAIVASLAYSRYKAGKLPIAFVSMDNCSKNGERLFQAVYKIALAWCDRGYVEKEFLEYLSNPDKVSFPWSMIDKITPNPAVAIKEKLEKLGINDMNIFTNNTNTYIAPFVNTEIKQYLVVEDSFPNGRMPLEKAGVLFTSREIVEKVEKMKVSTCLNPLHTALAIYGCLLGYKSIADEVNDIELKSLIKKIAFVEGMPVVVNPGIINPEDFVNEVIYERLPNPYIPDTPQRIAADTSQKLSIRFGETIKSYYKHDDLDPSSLIFIPLVIAGWCRYLLGIDDEGNKIEVSADPMLDQLQGYLKDIRVGSLNSYAGQLKPILSNTNLFSVNLYTVGLGEKIEGIFKELILGKGSVRNTLIKYLK